VGNFGPGRFAIRQLTLSLQSETVRQTWLRTDVEMRTIGMATRSVTFAGLLSLLAAAGAAQPAPQGTRVAQASQPAVDELSTPPVRRPPRRIPIYPRYQAEPDGVFPRYYPGPNAVRVCNATYVQEYRPSGIVIVPRMSCVWRRG